MNREDLTAQLTALLERTGHAHHEAFIQKDGADDDWALWYADYLQQPLSQLLGTELSRTTIVRCLVHLDEEAAAGRIAGDWKRGYAEHLVEHFVPGTEEKLALYYYDACPFCRRVLRVIDELGVDVERRDILRNPEHRTDLIAARGRQTVPVLRCTWDGGERWMPESSDIIAYLRKRFG